MSKLLPEPLKKIFLLTTGSETVECAIKLCRTHGVKAGGRGKHVIVSFDDAFHGRTLGAQQAGGIPALKEWIVNLDRGFIQVPFPDGFRNPRHFLRRVHARALTEQGVEPPNVAGVILETYQGGSAAFAPVEFMQRFDGNGAAGTRSCWSATKCRPDSAAPARCGASSITASFRTLPLFGKGHLQFAAAGCGRRAAGRDGSAAVPAA